MADEDAEEEPEVEEVPEDAEPEDAEPEEELDLELLSDCAGALLMAMIIYFPREPFSV